MSTSVTSATGLASAASAASTTLAAASTNPSSLANQNVFLQLLVAQLENQDPENPADGTQFVTQLAQFTTLQEQTEGTSDLDSILGIMQAAATTTPTTSQANTNSNTSPTSSPAGL
jgi:flagellar basal-body rod modification protein FlgD